LNTLSHEVGGIEADTELANHGDISARAERFHKPLGQYIRTTSQTWIVGPEIYLRPGFGNGTKVIDHISLGHADATVAEEESIILFVWGYPNEELLLRLKNGGISEGGVANLVKSIRTIGDDFTEENFFVGVESV
jgi:hypothetical protein